MGFQILSPTHTQYPRFKSIPYTNSFVHFTLQDKHQPKTRNWEMTAITNRLRKIIYKYRTQDSYQSKYAANENTKEIQ